MKNQVWLVFFAFLFLSSLASADDYHKDRAQKPSEKKPPAVTDKKSPSGTHLGLKGTKSKDELIKEIMLEINVWENDIFEIAPGLKKKMEADGKEYYTYPVGVQDVRLENLDKVALERLLTLIYGNEAKYRRRRIDEDLEATNPNRDIPRAPKRPATTPQQPPSLPSDNQ